MTNVAVPIIIPAYEPDGRLLSLLSDLRRAALSNIILVDDGSGEGCRPIFDEAEQKYGVTVLTHAENMGKGRALKDAFNYLLNRGGIIGAVTADSDGQHGASDIRRMIDALLAHPDELILGSRDFDSEGIPWKSEAGNKITRVVCRFLTGIRVSDTQTGLRAIPAKFMRRLLNVSGERFEFEMNMLIETKDCLPIREVPVETIYDSKEHHSTHFDPVKDSVRIYGIFGRMFLRFIVSSLSSSVLDLALFALFCAMLKGISAAGYLAAATVAARVLSAAYNYLVNYVFVFKSRQKKSTSAFRYAVLAVFLMTASAALVTAGAFLLPAVPEIVIKIAVDTGLFFVSYKLQQKVVFAKTSVSTTS